MATLRRRGTRWAADRCARAGSRRLTRLTGLCACSLSLGLCDAVAVGSGRPDRTSPASAGGSVNELARDGGRHSRFVWGSGSAGAIPRRCWSSSRRGRERSGVDRREPPPSRPPARRAAEPVREFASEERRPWPRRRDGLRVARSLHLYDQLVHLRPRPAAARIAGSRRDTSQTLSPEAQLRQTVYHTVRGEKRVV